MNKFCFFKITVTLLFLWQAGMLIAQNKDTVSVLNENNRNVLSEIVVTANRSEANRFCTSEAIESLKSNAIVNNQIRSCPEALSDMTGVFVQKTNHGGGSPFIRGLTGNQTLQVIDGIRLNNAIVRYGPIQYFNTIDVFSLEKIEVLRGSGSVQYGSDAMGGTVQAFTRNASFSPKPKWGSSLVSRIASQGMEQSLHTDVNYGNPKIGLRGGLTWRDFGDIIGGDTTSTQSPNGYHELDYDLKARVMLSKSSILTIAHQNVHQNDVPIYHKIVLENYAVNKIEPQNRRLSYLRLNQDFYSGIIRSTIFTLSVQNTEEGRISRKNGSNSLRSENDKVRSISFSAEALSRKVGIWSSSSGIETYYDHITSTRKDTDVTLGMDVSKRGLYPDHATMASFAAFTMHTFELPKWNLSAGTRFNSFLIHVEDDAEGKTELRPSALVGSVSIMRKLNSSSNLFVSANTGFRAPNIDDLGSLGIVDFRYETPNFNLKPEQSFQYQTGYKYQGTRLRAEFYLFRNELNNLIVRNKLAGDTIEGYPVYQKENAERAYLQGFETLWQYTISGAFSFSGSLTNTYGQNITKNEPMRRIPPLFGRVSAEYSVKTWFCSLEWLAAAKQSRLAKADIDDNRIPKGGTPGWNIFNFNAGYNWRFLNINFCLQNLLNKDYRYHGSGVNGYGRSALLSVVVKI
jgi:outer membrane cobalamin receptor